MLPDGGNLPPVLRRFPDPVIRFESEGDSLQIRSVNRAFEERFDDHTAVGGSSIRDFLDRVDTERDATVLVDRIVGGEAIDAEGRYETDGGTRYFRIRTVPDDDVPDGWLLCTDITDYEQRNRKLDQQNELLEDFASIVSHDLRNPLDVAKARLKAARETGEEVHFEKVTLAHDRMERIIRDVLTLARQGQVVDTMESTDLAGIVDDAWATVKVADASLELADELPAIRADADRLRQLLENLFRNAIEHGGETVTVRVGTTPDGFYVADDGPGIPESDRDRLFEPGYSTNDSTGIGLAIVERIADGHGWRLNVTSAEIGGARFEIDGIEAVNDPNPGG